MKIPRIPLNLGTIAQLGTFLQSRVLNAIQIAWQVEHRADSRHHFREGTWTPFDASGAGLALTTEAEYVKIGQLVFLGYAITYPATADGSNNLIGGLPFPCSRSINSLWKTPLSINTDPVNANTLVTISHTTTARFFSAGAVVPTNAQLSTDLLQGVLVYRALPE